MASTRQLRQRVQKRLADERGTVRKDAPGRVALVYPSPYHAGMSSLGFQTMYREINASSGWVAERAFLPKTPSEYRESRTPLFTYESERPVADFSVVALSVAYELELAGVVQTLALCGLPPLAEDRDERHPLVLAGGPLTFSNPLPLAPYVDAMLLGEADETIHDALERLADAPTKASALETLASDVPSCYVPSIHGDSLVAMGRADSERLPAYGQITTPHTELRNMFLIEAERGCSRGCRYCVMRRSESGGMRIVPKERILERIPSGQRRVGLVGAAVSDHPHIVEILEALTARGCEVGLSSLRPDRLGDRFATALRAAGYRTLTTASDGASQRLRDAMQRKARERHLVRAAQLVREHGFDRLKLYMIVGLPDERDEDIDELVAFGTELSRIAPVSLGIAPFVSKRNTPLDRMPFAGIDVVERRLARLRRGLKGRVDIRATSARWAWVEHVLAQGGRAEGRAVLEAVDNGGTFRAYKQAFDLLPAREPHRPLTVLG